MQKLWMVLLIVCACGVKPLVSSAATSSELKVHKSSAFSQMKTLNIMISKLRDLVYNLKDINQLEEIGMPKKDVLLMKNALKEKVDQVLGETVSLIRVL